LAAYEISDGSIRAYYHLENIVDSSGNAYTLSNHGTTAFESGLINNAAQLGSGNGSKYLDVGNDLSIGGGNIGISCWYKPATTPSGNYDTLIYQGDAGTNVHYTVNYVDSSGVKLLYTRGKNGVGDQQVTHAVTLSNGTWYHLVLNYNGTNVEGFLNGSSVGTTAASGSGSGGDSDALTIGAYTAPTNYADGMLDECVILNRPFSGAEITALYNGGAGQEVCFTAGCSPSASTSTTSTVSIQEAVNYADFLVDILALLFAFAAIFYIRR